ncbi:MAG: hypothetical protein H0V66_15415 [Bdellovibrionales bacterium]|nr:hypothetical protein [Bdellovibrionales bacterium]
MKILVFLICCLPSWLLAGEFLTQQEFKSLNEKQQVQMIKAYKDFVHEILKDEIESEELTASFRLLFIDEAFASGTFNCFYAGWPSQKKTVTTKGQKRTFCTSPLKSNPQYKKMAESCGPGQLLCQPVLFGANVCIEARTQKQRNSAFSQCQSKFEKSGKTLQGLAREIATEDMAPLADELFSLVHNICKSGFQSKTGMCSNLKKSVAAIKVNKPKVVEVVNEGKTVEDIKLETKLLKTVETVIEAPKETVVIEKKITCTQCEEMKKIEADEEVLAPHEASGPIDQNLKTAKDFCAGNQEGIDKETYFQGVFSDSDNEISVDVTYQEKAKDKANRTVGGHDVRAERMGKGYSTIEESVELPADETPLIYPRRSYQQEFMGRGKEGTFEIIDSPVKEVFENKKLVERYLSTDMRITQYSFFPRNNIPAIKKRDDKIIMRLTTGESIVIDAKSGRVINGAAKDLPPKNQTEIRPTNTRTFPDSDFSYQGEGLYIESKVTYNKDERSPGSIVPVKAMVDGKLQECKLKSDDLWTSDYGYYLPQEHEKYLSSYWSCKRFAFEKDEDLYAMIKKKCPTFKFPALILKN